MSVDLKIKVTKDVIFKAKDCGGDKGHNCPVALAIRDIFPNACVGSSRIFPFYDATQDVVIELPTAATYFINAFDLMHPKFRPALPELEFTITIPDEVIETIDIESLRPSLINHPTLELI